MTATLDPSLYPATYRIPFWNAFRKIALATAPFIALLVFRIVAVGQGGPLWMAIASAALVVILIVLLGSFLFAPVTLYPDRIERQFWFSKKTMPRAQVAGLAVRGSFNTPVLTSKVDGELPFALPSQVKTDAAWDAWMTVISSAGPGHATGL